MLKKIVDFLSSLWMTVIAGVFMLCDLIPNIINHFGGNFHPFAFMPFALSWVTVIISGIPLVYKAGYKLIFNKGIKRISSALLITVAMVSAIIIGDVFAAGEVAFIMAIGGILEDVTKDRAKRGLNKLLSLQPDTARKIEGDKELLLPLSEISVGDVVRVLPGERIAVDGEIILGSTSVDQSVMTGEWLPSDKTVGDVVYSGTVNAYGSIDIKVTKAKEETSLQKLIKLVKDAEKKKAPMARIADVVASWLVPIAFLIAIITGIITKDVVRSVSVLVVFCPCALVLATPTAIMAGVGQATKYGVIIKSGEALEKMSKVDVVAFDKTGTITTGELVVSNVVGFNKTEIELLNIVATAELKSEHPLAKAIVKYAKEKGVKAKQPKSFTMFAGKGVVAECAEGKAICGKQDFLIDEGVSIDGDALKKIQELQSEGKALILVAIDNEFIGIVGFSDVLKENAESAVKTLEELKVDTLLLTGDSKKTADYFAGQLGIRTVKANLLPEDKVKEIEKLELEGKTVCMVGDGVNDAPALKVSTVGVAMAGVGSDIASDSAEIVLMNDDVTKLPYLKRLAKATVNTIKFGITLSMCINFIGVTLSVLGLLSPTLGALIHNLGSCLVVLIATLLYDRKFIKEDKNRKRNKIERAV